MHLLNKLLMLALLSTFPAIGFAYPITSYLEMVKISNVSNTWTTLAVVNSYTNPVVACTYNLPSSSDVPGSVRVQLVGSAIQVKVQQPLNGDVTPSDVYCTISEEGSYTSPIKYEAHTISSTQTNQQGSWSSALMIDITASKSQTYTQPVVTGQVMSANDENYVTFFSTACTSRLDPASNTSMCIGKHTGESDIDTAYTETLGYFIAEQADYTLSNANVKIALGADTIDGVNNAGASYSLSGSYTYATATIASIDGVDGGWAVLFEADPVSTTLKLAIDEDTVRNAERSHVTEQVAYWAMEPIYSAELSLDKTVATIYDPVNLTSNPKAIPGAILEYTLTGKNTGWGAADPDTIVLTDLIPENSQLCVVDSGHCLAPYFTDGSTSSGLSLTSNTYSNNGGATYAYSATAGADGTDSAVTHLKSSLAGSFEGRTGTVIPSFTVKLRVMVD